VATGSARHAGPGFFPLDDELGLLPGGLSPTVEAGLVRLCAWMPFEQAAEYLAFFWGVQISKSTARRHAERGGAAYVAVQAAELERLERACPAPPPGPALQQVSADGAMVPLVGGRWAEVRTLAIGTLGVAAGPEPAARDSPRVTEVSYFSRLADHAAFSRQAYVELYRRGTEQAGRVIGVMDGAEWEQKLLDRYRPDAVRVLDFPHALEHLATAAQATFGVGNAANAWLAEQAHTFKHGLPSQVLAALRALPTAQAGDPAAACRARDETLGYLERRLDQIRYAEFLALGYPIGSGLVESANKLVVEARLKGSGMHWEDQNVNPMLALRNIACADRWAEAWPLICQQLRVQAQACRAARRQARQPAAPEPVQPKRPAPRRAPKPPPAHPPLVVDGRPTANHPWRRPFLAGGRLKTAS
jgi:hypothetical protein